MRPSGGPPKAAEPERHTERGRVLGILQRARLAAGTFTHTHTRGPRNGGALLALARAGGVKDIALGWASASKGAKNAKADSTLRCSQAVPHPSTNRALCRLTSEVKRDPVHSTRYGRQRHQAKTGQPTKRRRTTPTNERARQTQRDQRARQQTKTNQSRRNTTHTTPNNDETPQSRSAVTAVRNDRDQATATHRTATRPPHTSVNKALRTP